MFNLGVVTVLVSCIGVVLTQYPECESVSVSGAMKWTKVSHCNSSGPPCVLKKGSNVTLTITFVPGLDTNGLVAKAFASLGRANLPFRALDPNACDPKFGLACPLKADTEYTYENIIKIETSFPTLTNFHTKWLLIDDTNLPVVCIKIPTSIV